MKILSFLIVIFLANSISYSQSLDELDNKFGFKEFHFGDTKSKWNTWIVKSKSDTPNAYQYVEPCCTSAFNSSVAFIVLIFDNQDKLSKIMLYMRDNQQSVGRERFLSSIQTAFGEPNDSYSPNDNSGDMVVRWQGKKVTLTMLHTYHGVVEGGWQISLLFALTLDTVKLSKDY